MRIISFLLPATALILAMPRGAAAQGANPPPQPATSQNFSNATSAPKDSAVSAAGECCASQPDQPTSLGEVARLARAKKASQPKATRIFDDENMPRAPLRAGDKAPGLGDSGASGEGKVTLLDFWASWCGPCRESLPGLRQLEAIYGGEGFEVVSVNEDDDSATGQRFAAQNQMNWTQRFDPNHQLMRQYGASALPTYILIGKDGTVVQQYVGHDPYNPVVSRIGPDVKKSLEQAE
jgi:thiol-disulfide isomerase/thioredoxin